MKEIEFVLELQGDTSKVLVLCSIFENPVTVHEDIQWGIALAVTPQMRLRIKHIVIKYHLLWSFVANGDVKIKHIDTKEKIMYILMKTIDSDLSRYLRYRFNSWWINGILIC